MTQRTGGCLCGAVRFTVSGEPRRVGICHCRSCRRATGAAFSVFVDVPRRAVVLEGEPAVWRSSPGVERWFCKTCGSALAYCGAESPDEINLHLGMFDACGAFVPNAVSFESEALGWAGAMLANPHRKAAP